MAVESGVVVVVLLSGVWSSGGSLDFIYSWMWVDVPGAWQSHFLGIDPEALNSVGFPMASKVETP